MLLIGCGVAGPPKMIAAALIATNKPKQIRKIRFTASNENKMSDGGRGRASLGVKVWKSSQEWSVERSAIRSIAWLGDWLDNTRRDKKDQGDNQKADADGMKRIPAPAQLTPVGRE